jgi:hypothetical protein
MRPSGRSSVHKGLPEQVSDVARPDYASSTPSQLAAACRMRPQPVKDWLQRGLVEYTTAGPLCVTVYIRSSTASGAWQPAFSVLLPYRGRPSARRSSIRAQHAGEERYRMG